MLWSKSFIPTLRDDPAGVDSPARRLLVRAGYMRQVASGWSYLPLGQRTLLKITGIMRDELHAAGAQEFFVPETCSSDDQTAVGDDFIEIARREIRSYKALPQLWFRIGTKDHDGHTMNSLSLDANRKGLDDSYAAQLDAVRRIFARCGLKFPVSESAPDEEGRRSRDLMASLDSGPDLMVTCACGYAASRDRAGSRLAKIEDDPASGKPDEVHTPGQRTIAEVADFLQVPPTHQIKSLAYAVDDTLCLFLLRGDHQLNESKAATAMNGLRLRPARPEEIRSAFGADAGSLGPLGISTIAICTDLALQGRQNLVCGANRNDYHVRGVTPGLHFRTVWADLREVEKNECCTECGRPLDIVPAVLLGRVRQIGTVKSSGADLTVLAADGKQTPMLTGRCEIDREKLMLASVELGHDADGILWPASIAPFAAVITPVNNKGDVKAAAERLHSELADAGIEVLLDDRDERPGVKFKDADLIGVPFRIVLGPEKVKQGLAEFIVRASRTTEVLGLDSLVSAVRAKLAL